MSTPSTPTGQPSPSTSTSQPAPSTTASTSTTSTSSSMSTPPTSPSMPSSSTLTSQPTASTSTSQPTDSTSASQSTPSSSTASCSKGGPHTRPSSSVSSTTPPPISTGATPPQAVTNPTTPVSPSYPESPWMTFVLEAFPNLHTQPYFVPPFQFNRVPFYPVVIAGKTVQVREHPPPPSKPKKGQHPAESQVAGCVFTENSPGLKTSKPSDSDLQGDRAQGHSLRCMKVFAEATHQVMVVISELKFRKYLDKVTDPIYAAAIAMLPNMSNAPPSLTESQKSGECDIIMIHSLYGIIEAEIKSVGEKDVENTELNTIKYEVKKAVDQLNDRSQVLNHLVSDQGVKVTKAIMLPNVTCRQLEQTLDNYDWLKKKLCECFGVQDTASAVKRCLCKDMMPDTQQLQHSADTSGGSSSDGWMTAMKSWWEDTVVKSGVDPAMDPDIYERLVARFCGPATTIEIHTPCPPRKAIRTHGEAVAETGLRLSRLALYLPQMDLLNSPLPPFVYLEGPPGTGKTVVLVLKALQWLNQGKHVHLVSTYPNSHALTTLIHHQLQASVPSATTKNLLHLKKYDFLHRPKDVEDAVKELTAPAFGDLHLVIDEVGSQVEHRIKELITKVQSKIQSTGHTVSVWCAGLHLLPSLTSFHVCPLTDPLRCPPTVHRQVAQSKRLTGEYTIQHHLRETQSVPYKELRACLLRHHHRLTPYLHQNPPLQVLLSQTLLVLVAMSLLDLQGHPDQECRRQVLLDFYIIFFQALPSLGITMDLKIPARYTSPSNPPVTDGPEVKWLRHAGQPGHSGISPLHCGKCGELVVQELRQLGVGQPGCVQYKDVIILANETTVSAPMVLELRRQQILVEVMDWSDASITDIALAVGNHVIVADPMAVSGLERRVVIGMKGRAGGNDRMQAMSRCTGQLYWFDEPCD